MNRAAKDNETAQQSGAPSQPYWVRIVSGSVGSTLTALLVTPLEVVKVRLQSQPLPSPSVSSASAASAATNTIPSNVSLCPRGCGTFVLNNGIAECVLPKSAVPYFDSAGKVIHPSIVPNRIGKSLSSSSSSSSSSSRGTFGMIRSIFLKEGLAGIYAGIYPTLVMGVPNTVLYFVTYEELAGRLKQYSTPSSDTNSIGWIPAFAGASARLVATASTAPLELIRTRQAARVGNSEPAIGMITEFQTMIRAEGFGSLYKGLSPTLFRDVPFSAVYWYCIESLRSQWKESREANNQYGPISAWEQAGQALFNGSVAGMIAAACTTPLDVVKTRRQVDTKVLVESTVSSSSSSTSSATATATATTTTAICDHQGAVVYDSKAQSPGTLGTMRSIVQTEGISGLWRGNQARMIKVAPACAIMISSYEIGKRILTEE